MDATFALGPYTLSMDVEHQTILVQNEPDPDWRYVDLAGHGHFRSNIGDHYPTLKWAETDPGGMDSDGEEWPPTGHHECRHCGEHIVPGARLGRPQQIETGRTFTITGPEGSRRITQEEFDSIANMVADGQAAVQERLAALLVG